MDNTPRIPREHFEDDKDKTTLAGHHSLGMGEGQMSPGNHNHSVNDPGSRPIFEGVDISLPGLTPEEQLQKIWDIIGGWGGVVIGGGIITPPGIEFFLPGDPYPEPTPLQYPGDFKSVWYAGMSSTKDYLNTVNDQYYSEATPGWLLNISALANEISFLAGPNNRYHAIFNNARLDYDGATDSEATSSITGTSLASMNSSSETGQDHTYKFVYTAPVPAGPEWNYVAFNLGLCFDPGLVYVEEERVGPGGAIPARYYRSVIYDVNSLPPTEVWSNGWQLGGDFEKWVISQARYTGFTKFYKCGPGQWYIERAFQPDEVWNLSAAGPSLVASHSSISDTGWTEVGTFQALNLQLRRNGANYAIFDLTTGGIVAGPKTLSEMGAPDLAAAFGTWDIDYEWEHNTSDNDTLVFTMNHQSYNEPINIVSINTSLELSPLGAFWFGNKAGSAASHTHGVSQSAHVWADGSWAIVVGVNQNYGLDHVRPVVLRSDRSAGTVLPDADSSSNPYSRSLVLNTYNKEEAYCRSSRYSIADAKTVEALGLTPFNTPPQYPGTGWSASLAGNRAIMFWPTAGAGAEFYAADLAAQEGP